MDSEILDQLTNIEKNVDSEVTKLSLCRDWVLYVTCNISENNVFI